MKLSPPQLSLLSALERAQPRALYRLDLARSLRIGANTTVGALTKMERQGLVGVYWIEADSDYLVELTERGRLAIKSRLAKPRPPKFGEQLEAEL